MATDLEQLKQLRKLLQETFIGLTTGDVSKEEAKTIARMANEFHTTYQLETQRKQNHGH